MPIDMNSVAEKFFHIKRLQQLAHVRSEIVGMMEEMIAKMLVRDRIPDNEERIARYEHHRARIAGEAAGFSFAANEMIYDEFQKIRPDT